MKKTKLLTLAALFSILTALFCINAYAQENTLTLYIDQSTTVEAPAQDGTKEAPFSTTKAAQDYAAKQPYSNIVFHLLSDYTVEAGGSGYTGIDGKTLKITADFNTTVFQLNKNYINQIKGDVIFDNVTVGNGYTGDDINLKGNNLTFGENTIVSDQNLNINQSWSDSYALDNQVVDISGTNWKIINVNIANNSGGTLTGATTVKVSGNTTVQGLGLIKSTAFYGTQNYIINATVRDLYLGVKSAQKGKRYVQVNAGGVVDGYTTGDATGLTADDLSGVNIIEINGGSFNKSGDGTTGGENKTEPANYKKINAYPGSEEAWKNVTRAVIFNNNVLGDVEVTDTAAIVLRVAKGGKAQAVTTEPTAENDWACSLLGFEIDLPEGYSTVLIDGKIATANDGLYTITEAGEHTVDFEKDYEIKAFADNADAGTVTGAGTYAYGTKATLKAQAKSGYEFSGWYIGDEKVSDNAEYEITVKTNADYTAKFAKAKIEIKGSVIFAKEENAPYNETYDDGTTYNNAAAISIYDGEELIFTAKENQNGVLEFTLSEEYGTYRVVIVKNGYVTYDKETEIKTGTELNGIKLTPGDIKDSYDEPCGDGKIDIDDFVRVLRGFSNGASDKLRHAVDINEDGKVNVTDLGYIKAAINGK